MTDARSRRLNEVVYPTSDILSITLESVESEIFSVHWNVTDFTQTSLDIQLTFDNPMSISQDASGIKDKLTIEFLSPEFFASESGNTV